MYDSIRLIKRKDVTLKEFLLIEDFIAPEYADWLNNCPPPDSLCGCLCPKDLDSLKFGQLLQLQAISDTSELLFIPPHVVLGIKDAKLLEAPVSAVIGFSKWCAKELERIGKLFREATGTPTPEERQAGIDQLNFGMFGMVDWFATRMGITDHDVVLSTPWLRVYQCLNIDTQKREYEKRLREVYSSKH